MNNSTYGNLSMQHEAVDNNSNFKSSNKVNINRTTIKRPQNLGCGALKNNTSSDLPLGYPQTSHKENPLIGTGSLGGLETSQVSKRLDPTKPCKLQGIIDDAVVSFNIKCSVVKPQPSQCWNIIRNTSDCKLAQETCQGESTLSGLPNTPTDSISKQTKLLLQRRKMFSKLINYEKPKLPEKELQHSKNIPSHKVVPRSQSDTRLVEKHETDVIHKRRKSLPSIADIPDEKSDTGGLTLTARSYEEKTSKKCNAKGNKIIPSIHDNQNSNNKNRKVYKTKFSS